MLVLCEKKDFVLKIISVAFFAILTVIILVHLHYTYQNITKLTWISELR